MLVDLAMTLDPDDYDAAFQKFYLKETNFVKPEDSVEWFDTILFQQKTQTMLHLYIDLQLPRNLVIWKKVPSLQKQQLQTKAKKR